MSTMASSAVDLSDTFFVEQFQQMVEHRQSPLSGGQTQLAKRYEPVLETLHTELAEPFKFRDVTIRFDDIGHGGMLRMKKAGLLRNEIGNPNSTKDWYLTRKTKRWLRSR